ncbi:MAG: acetylxylan esterase [Chloroflexi bacterium]|nr:acetylxylan esterase [Chloroflexota bacterium]
MAATPDYLSQRELDPLNYLKDLYGKTEHRLAFRATSKAAFYDWQRELRITLTRLLGGWPTERVPLRLEQYGEQVFDTWRRTQVIYDTNVGVSVPAHILYPVKGHGPFPAVVALHGHGYGKHDLVGLDTAGKERQGDPGIHQDFALRLVERGFVVIAPEQAGFGERRDPATQALGPGEWACRQLSLHAQMLGKTVIGMRVWDTMRAVDVLQSLPEVDGERIGCMGLSGGGTTTLFTAALEERIKVIVVSGYLNSFKDSILAVRHCDCNYVPGILQYMEMVDIACTLAPRPLLVESGSEDPIFPIETTKAVFRQVGEAYRLLGVPERLESDFFEGGHRISGQKAYDWLERWLAR